jgi:hypothetical protein
MNAKNAKEARDGGVSASYESLANRLYVSTVTRIRRSIIMNATAISPSRPLRHNGISRTSKSALLATLILVVGISPSIDVLLHAKTAFAASPQDASDRSATLATAYHIVNGVLGHAVLTQVAPTRLAHQAFLSSALAIAFHIAATASRIAPALAPPCYRIGFVEVVLPQSWLAARLLLSQSRSCTATEKDPAFTSN